MRDDEKNESGDKTVDYKTPATEEAGEKLVLSSPDEARTVKDYLLWAGVIALMVLTVYSPALRGRFLWDDDRHVERNLALRQGAEGLQRIWFVPRSQPQYYPLTHTTYWIEYQLAASETGEIGPTVFHVTNAVLHAAAAILLWFVLRQLGLPGAWVIAAIFAVHPIQVESVAWISERKNVLSGAFYFGAMLVYLRAFGIGEGPGFRVQGSGEREDTGNAESEFPWNMYLGALGLFVGGMLSKTVACSMPAVVLLVMWWKGWNRRAALGLIPFFVIGAALAIVTVRMEQTNVGASGVEWELSWAQRILVAGRAIWFYVGKTLLPVNLTFIYPRWDVNPADVMQWKYPIAVIVVLVALAGLQNRIGRGPVVAALIYCGVLLPALGFFNVYPHRYSWVADHFQYLACPALVAGVVVAIARALDRVQPSRETDEPQPTPYVLSGVVLIVLGVMSFQRAKVFDGMVPLFRDVVRKNPSSWMAHYNLGTALAEDVNKATELDPDQSRAMLDEAVGHFETAVKLRPDHDRALNNWGIILLRRGEIDAAIDKFRRALAINPRNVSTMTNLGQAMHRQKNYEEAVRLYREALRIAESQRTVSKAEQSGIYQSLGLSLEALKQPEQTMGAYAEAVELNRNNLAARLQYGELLARSGKLVEAASQFGTILRNNPAHVPARVRLAQIQIKVGNLGPARDHLKIAGQLNPKAPQLLETALAWNRTVAAREAATRPTTGPATQIAATQAATTQAATTRPGTMPATTQVTTYVPPDVVKTIDELLAAEMVASPTTAPSTAPATAPATTQSAG